MRRFLKPFPLLYLFCAIAAILGGAIHAPTNHDALCYRVPRLLHWLAAEQWHWIGGFDPRMDYSACGYESMMLPVLGALYTLRFTFLINVACFLLFPGLIFTVFSGLGIRHGIVSIWMWVLPCGSCFAMSAGSIGNDLPGCILILASLMFGLRAYKHGRARDVALSVFSAALMTSLKASNLPLLLPAFLCLLPAFLKHRTLFKPAALAFALSVPISFLPTAVANLCYTGDWKGSPGSSFELHHPLAGFGGNSILIAGGSLAPAVFPVSEKINATFDDLTRIPPLCRIKERFGDFRMTHPQLATEESSGLGLGVTSVLALGFVRSRNRIRPKRLWGYGGLVSTGFLVAAIFYMAKLGNCGAPRIVSPYYAGLILPVLLLIDSRSFFTSRTWTAAGFALMVPIVPALLCSPARPLLPMTSLVEHFRESGIMSGLMERMDSVYKTYATRADAFASVRNLLPPQADTIGFGGSSGEPQYSFWLPMGKKRVVDLRTRPILSPTEYDAVVVSDRGCMERFGITPEQLAESNNWRITATVSARNLVALGPSRWCVMVPRNPEQPDMIKKTEHY